MDRNLKTPYQDEWRVLFERELFTETLMRVEYINRKYRDQLQNRGHQPRCRATSAAAGGRCRDLNGDPRSA